MKPPSFSFALHIPTHQSVRTVKTTFNNEAAWTKHALDKGSAVQHALGLALRPLTGLSIFNRTRAHKQGRAALAFEAARMEQLGGIGFRVPRVLAHAPDWSWMTTSDLGENLRAVVDATPDIQTRRVYLDMGMEALAVMHAYGAWHGRPYQRDLTISRRGIGWLDFEHDAGSVMPLEQAQARDTLLYLVGATRWARDDAALLPHLVSLYAKRAPQAPVDMLARVGQALSPLALLPMRAGAAVDAITGVLPYRRPAARGAAHKAGPQA